MSQGEVCNPPCPFYELGSCMCAHIEAGGYVAHFGTNKCQKTGHILKRRPKFSKRGSAGKFLRNPWLVKWLKTI